MLPRFELSPAAASALSGAQTASDGVVRLEAGGFLSEAVHLLAAHFGVPVCPHAGGVGLCEYVQHASFFDYIAVSGSLAGRCIEYVDHLHEHFVDPCIVTGGCYRMPLAAGSAIAIKPESLAAHTFPDGPIWKALA